jgi:putative ABC transport system substrate-binding protein
MKRRSFLTLLGGAAAAWPLAARAQQAAMPVIGFLSSASRALNSELSPPGFRSGLSEAGYVLGRNLTIEAFLADGHYDRLPALANEIVRRRVNLILAAGGLPSARAAKAATSTIPILFIAGFDPVKVGLVSSFNRPGGNATGVSIYTTELLGKRYEFLRELLPRAGSVALLVNPLSPAADIEIDDMESTARANGFRLLVLKATNEPELEAAFASAVRDRVDGLLVSADPFFTARRSRVVALAEQHRVPAIYPWQEYVEIGGLMSYGPSLTKAYHLLGLYAGRILKGEKPGELPVQMPTNFELVINKRTATSFRLEIPTLLLVLAEKIIE